MHTRKALAKYASKTELDLNKRALIYSKKSLDNNAKKLGIKT